MRFSRTKLRRSLVLSLAASPLAAALAVTTASCARERPRPDVLLISVDTLRADRVGLYGYERDTTPNIDLFFSKGSIFERAVASAPCTVPSVRQYLTGRLVRNPEAKTLAEMLRGVGYRTGAVVSQHCFTEPGAWPYARGFEEFDVQGPEELDHHGLTTRTAEIVTDRALAWLERTEGDERPFFLWLHYFDPHDPYEPPEGFRTFDSGNDSTRSGDRRRYLQEERRSKREPWWSAGYVFSRADVEHFRNLYDGEIRFTDAQIGRVLDALAERGGVASSVVALLADHGERLGGGNLWDHCLSLDEAELRVPLLLRQRGGALHGRSRWSQRASTLDLVPTLLALAGLEGEATDGRNWLADSTSPGKAVAQWGPLRAVYRGRWKLLTKGGSHHLYDLRADPGGRVNVAQAHPDIVAELLTRGQPEQAQRVAEETEAERERLRSLGYID